MSKKATKATLTERSLTVEETAEALGVSKGATRILKKKAYRIVDGEKRGRGGQRVGTGVSRKKRK